MESPQERTLLQRDFIGAELFATVVGVLVLDAEGATIVGILAGIGSVGFVIDAFRRVARMDRNERAAQHDQFPDREI